MRVTPPRSYQKAIRDITRLMGQGMSRYAKLHAESGGKFSVDTLASFDLYCHYVAGLVGEGLSRLFSASEKESPYLGEQLTLSNSMGLMLQKTNILRDFREDVDEGRVFWPAEIWSKYVSKPEELHAPGNDDGRRARARDRRARLPLVAVEPVRVQLLRHPPSHGHCDPRTLLHEL